MKILFVTDLHGSEWKYDKIFEVAMNMNIDIIINGGDMLPLGNNLLNQDKFIVNFLDEYLSNFNSEKIYYITMFGNDDLQMFDNLFQNICDKYDYVFNINFQKISIKKYEFIGMNLVPDLPFILKDRARKDTKEFVFPKQLGTPLLSTVLGLKKIENWFSYVETLPTIEEEINNLIRPSNMERANYIIHTPPSNISLDVCFDGRGVGSKAIYDFIKKNQPMMTFHGHIHESPEISGKWCNKIGRTLCFQPGQSQFHQKHLIYAIIDMESMNFDRKLII